MPGEPLILTLKIDDKAQDYFNAMRKQHFPPGRNFIDAHLTLFHHLPADEQQIISDIESLATRNQRFGMQVEGVVSIGNGVAYKIDSDHLKRLHKQLQTCWKAYTTQQDRQGLWPHITIQNKVSQATASALKDKLSAEFKPFAVTALGFSLWTYLGGPWEWVRDIEFSK